MPVRPSSRPQGTRPSDVAVCSIQPSTVPVLAKDLNIPRPTPPAEMDGKMPFPLHHFDPFCTARYLTLACFNSFWDRSWTDFLYFFAPFCSIWYRGASYLIPGKKPLRGTGHKGQGVAESHWIYIRDGSTREARGKCQVSGAGAPGQEGISRRRKSRQSPSRRFHSAGQGRGFFTP